MITLCIRVGTGQVSVTEFDHLYYTETIAAVTSATRHPLVRSHLPQLVLFDRGDCTGPQRVNRLPVHAGNEGG